MAVEETGTIDTGPPTDEVPAERRYTAPSGMDSSTTKFIESNARPGDGDHLDAHRTDLAQQTGCAADDPAARRRAPAAGPAGAAGAG